MSAIIAGRVAGKQNRPKPRIIRTYAPSFCNSRRIRSCGAPSYLHTLQDLKTVSFHTVSRAAGLTPVVCAVTKNTPGWGGSIRAVRTGCMPDRLDRGDFLTLRASGKLVGSRGHRVNVHERRDSHPTGGRHTLARPSLFFSDRLASPLPASPLLSSPCANYRGRGWPLPQLLQIQPLPYWSLATNHNPPHASMWPSSSGTAVPPTRGVSLPRSSDTATKMSLGRPISTPCWMCIVSPAASLPCFTR